MSNRTYLQTSKHTLVTYKLTYCLYSRDFIPYLILLSLTSLQALVKTWVAFEQHNLLTNLKTFLSSFTNLPILYLQVLITYLLKPFISYQFTCSKKFLVTFEQQNFTYKPKNTPFSLTNLLTVCTYKPSYLTLPISRLTNNLHLQSQNFCQLKIRLQSANLTFCNNANVLYVRCLNSAKLKYNYLSFKRFS